NMLRAVAITLVLLLSVGIMLPFANSAHGIRQSTQITQKKSKRYRSRAWWRRYRARMRAKRAAEELARRNALLALPQSLATAVPQNGAAGDLSAVAGPASPSAPANSGSLSFNELPPLAMRAPVTIETPDLNVVQTTNPSMRATAAKINVPAPAPTFKFRAAETTANVPGPATTFNFPPAVVVSPAMEAPAAASPATVSAHAAATATRPRVVNAVHPVMNPESNTPKLPG